MCNKTYYRGRCEVVPKKWIWLPDYQDEMPLIVVVVQQTLRSPQCQESTSSTIYHIVEPSACLALESELNEGLKHLNRLLLNNSTPSTLLHVRCMYRGTVDNNVCVHVIIILL